MSAVCVITPVVSRPKGRPQMQGERGGRRQSSRKYVPTAPCGGTDRLTEVDREETDKEPVVPSLDVVPTCTRPEFCPEPDLLEALICSLLSPA